MCTFGYGLGTFYLFIRPGYHPATDTRSLVQSAQYAPTSGSLLWCGQKERLQLGYAPTRATIKHGIFLLGMTFLIVALAGLKLAPKCER